VVGRLLSRPYRRIDAALQRGGEFLKADIRRILVCRPNHRLGNALLLTPLIVELARIFPEARVDVVLGGSAGPEIFQNFSNIANVICLPRHMAKHPVQVVRTLIQLRRERYDLAIDPCESSQSGRLLLTAAKARYSIGIAKPASGRDSDMQAATRNAPAHMAQLPVFLLRDALSSAQFERRTDYPELTLGLSAAERQAGRVVLDALTDADSLSPRATLGIFASASGSKRLNREWWLRFVSAISAHQPTYQIVELSTEPFQSALPQDLPSHSSKHILEVAAFLSNMTCFVSADCGVMHLASASATTTVGLFCVSDPEKYAPYGKLSRSIVIGGRSPEEVAQAVAAIVEARISDKPLADDAANLITAAPPAAATQGATQLPPAAPAGRRPPVPAAR
jgi:ADP-heptose:LPS heptosyltransferase